MTQQYTDERIIEILRLMSQQDIDGLDALGIDDMPPEFRIRILIRWLEIKSERALQRKAKLADWEFLKRKKGSEEKPADVVRDFLTSPEFLIAIGTLASVLNITGGLVSLAIEYRQAHQLDRAQARILSNYLSAKLGRGASATQIENIECLRPELRIFANSISPDRARQIIEGGDIGKHEIKTFRAEGKAFVAHYERPLSLVGVAIADINPAEPWGLPWLEDDLPPLPGAKLKPAPAPDSKRADAARPSM